MADSSPSGAPRRLSAVMFLDMVSYSARMAAAESETLQLVHELERIVKDSVGEGGGRVVKFMGDGSMAEFPNAAAAVMAAMRIQQTIETRNRPVATASRLKVRIGIHLGDVVEEGGDLFGDAVNIAARVQPLADPGGIAMTAGVVDQVRSLLRVRGTVVRGVRLKNIPQKMDIFLSLPAGSSFITWYVSKKRRHIVAGVVALGLVAGGFLAYRQMTARTILVQDFEDPGTLGPYSGREASISMRSVGGPVGMAIEVQMRGAPNEEGYCGFMAQDAGMILRGDWSGHAGLQFYGKSLRGRPLNLVLIEQGVSGKSGEGGEFWVHELELPTTYAQVRVPFAVFRKRAGYQPPGQDNNDRLDLDRMHGVAMEIKLSGEEAADTFSFDQMELVRDRWNRAPLKPEPMVTACAGSVGGECGIAFRASDPDGEAVSLMVDWGDGNTDQTAVLPKREWNVVRHVYASQGDYSVRAKAVDVCHESSGWSEPVAVSVRPGDIVLDHMEDERGVTAPAGTGGEVQLEPDDGHIGRCIRIRARGTEQESYWLVAKQADPFRGGDWSGCTGIRFMYRSMTDASIRVAVVEKGVSNPSLEGEAWVFQLPSAEKWRLATVPFSSFVPRPEYQPPAADGNGQLNLNRVKRVQFMFTVPTAEYDFQIDELELLLSPVKESIEPVTTPGR